MKNLSDSRLIRACGAAATALLTCGFAGLAGAATPDDEAPSIVVHYGDLNLQTDSGLRTLQRRLSAAAAKVCPTPISNSDLEGVTAAHNCRAAAIARATRSLPDEHLVEVMTRRLQAG